MQIVTYNIWFNQKERKKRAESLCHEILTYNSDIDVLCFQEVTPQVLEYLNELLSDVYLYHYPNEIEYYGSITFSRHPFVDAHETHFVSNMGRKLVTVIVDIDNTMIAIGNCHYESEFGDKNIVKLCQYDVTKRMLSSYNIPVIMCADTNIQEHEEDEYLNDTQWKDSWKEAGEPTNKKYTYDSFINKHHKYKKLRCRIDRINYKGNLKQTKFELLKGVNGKIQPSDHYGVLVELE